MIRILLVEDDFINQTVIQDIIEFDCPFAELTCAETGEDALEMARRDGPDLVLMDLGLPGIDGLEATRRLRAQAENARVTIWALTAHAMKGFEKTAMESGCDAYITKPIDTKSLVTRLSNFNELAPEQRLSSNGAVVESA